jgi:hypothetical protein
VYGLVSVELLFNGHLRSGGQHAFPTSSPGTMNMAGALRFLQELTIHFIKASGIPESFGEHSNIEPVVCTLDIKAN